MNIKPAIENKQILFYPRYFDDILKFTITQKSLLNRAYHTSTHFILIFNFKLHTK